MDFLESLRGKRTVIVNGLLLLLSGVAYFLPDAELPDATAIGAAFDALDSALVRIVAIANLVLRAITTTPIWSKS